MIVVTTDVIALLARRIQELAEARALLEYALHLRQHGENAPGGNETWSQFDRDAEAYLRRVSRFREERK